ncbi:hypothetical protein [Candidatus Leptofilum sp.]|uniref:hypothetical protein n=1 Tax=Candidatus Leptofilum sp. TaxID=3241576 RepID=UPI003B5CC819
MRITLERNTAVNADQVPYLARVEIITSTVHAGSIFEIPIYVAHQGTQKQFYVKLLGVRLEREHPSELLAPIQERLVQLIHLARLPTYLFIARRARGIYPVYTIGSEVTATTPGGPIFRHVELAKVREYLTDYLHDAGILGAAGPSDKLHVRGVNMHTLALRRPLFYLKKRVPGEVDFWAPVFESGDGQKIYAYAADERREVVKSDGREVMLLCEAVATALLADGRLQQNYDLRADRLFPDQWDALQGLLKEDPPITVTGVALPCYRDDAVWLAVESRLEENRFGLYLGRTKAELEQRILADFLRRELVPA